jgi:hypothetical protein
MLNQKDIDIIKDIIKEALTIEVRMEKFDQLNGIWEHKTEKVYIPTFWVEYLPKITAALRGMQEDVDHTKNRVAENVQRSDAIIGILLQSENAIKKLVMAANTIPTQYLQEGN